MQMHKYYIHIWLYSNYVYLYTIVPKHSGPRGHQALQQSGETMLDNYDHTRKTIILPDQSFHNGRLWQIQGASMNKQPQMLPMYAMLQLRIKSFSDGQESKHQQIMRNLHLRLIPPGASFISFHLRCCFRSAVGARLFARLTARHGVFLFTFFTARNISLWRERGSLREVGGVSNNVLLRCALIWSMVHGC